MSGRNVRKSSRISAKTSSSALELASATAAAAAIEAAAAAATAASIAKKTVKKKTTQKKKKEREGQEQEEERKEIQHRQEQEYEGEDEWEELAQAEARVAHLRQRRKERQEREKKKEPEEEFVEYEEEQEYRSDEEREIDQLRERNSLHLSRISELEEEVRGKKREEDVVIPLYKVPLVPFKGTVTSTAGGNELEGWMLFLDMQISAYPSTLHSDMAKIKYAASMFQGDALQWWMRSAEREKMKTWKQFIAAVESRFRPINITTNSLYTFHTLKQGERQTVAEYIASFTSATSTLTLDQVSEVMRIIQFINGLKGPIQSKMKEEYEVDKMSMTEVQSLAVRRELMMTSRSSTSSYSSSSSSSSSSSLHAISTSDHQDGGEEAETMEVYGHKVSKNEFLNFMQQKNGGGAGYSSNSNSSRPPYRGGNRMSDEERERRRKNDLCYTCGKPGHISAKCFSKGKSNNNSSSSSRSSSSSSSSRDSKK